MQTTGPYLPPIDASIVPFSRKETNWAVSLGGRPPAEPTRLYLRYIYGGSSTDLYRLDLGDGDLYEVYADPSHLVATTKGGGRLEIVVSDPRVVRVRVSGQSVRFSLSEAFSSAGDWRWEELIPASCAEADTSRCTAWRAMIRQCKHYISLLNGEARIDAQWRPGSEGSHRHHRCDPLAFEIAAGSEIAIESYSSEWEPREYSVSFDECVAAAAKDFLRWHEAGPSYPEQYAAAGALASYVTWSAIVPAGGNFQAPTMLMSKRWMNSAWNWDNYFNAWGTTLRDPSFARIQYNLHFSHQHPQGALGDAINELTIGWTYTKPPMHGWVLKRMLEIYPYTDEDLRPLYEPLCRWTEWWFRYRDDDKDGICQYHHGNDSGWDDASAFDVTPPVESSDLNALLVIQMEVLGDLAERFGMADQAATWRGRAAQALRVLLDHSFVDDRFVAMQSGSHVRVEDGGDSLLCCIPVVLGHRLPRGHFEALVDGLADPGRFLQRCGLSTESGRSPHFLEEGYWRGPMWAPAVMMIVDGLHDGGAHSLADEITRRFCDACASGGFAECFNPVTGAPLHDPAYTWTANVFALLAGQRAGAPVQPKERVYDRS